LGFSDEIQGYHRRGWLSIIREARSKSSSRSIASFRAKPTQTLSRFGIEPMSREPAEKPGCFCS
jgi:hypothetical protein